jgi:predicted component of type VI protein secretion system
MRWLCGTVMGVGLLTMLVAGCGDSADDDLLVLRFVSFDGSGIGQADSVRANSADVDVQLDLCEIDDDGNLVFEPFTQTVINAIFRNEQASDIRLERVRVDAGPRSGLAPIEQRITANIPGGRCDNIPERRCAVNNDCIGEEEVGQCIRTESTVPGILLFDFLAKEAVNPDILGEATNVTVSFYATDDTDSSLFVQTGYVVTFDNFDNCEAGGQ